MSVVRAPAVAGRFYPDDPGELRSTIASYLDEVPPTDAPPPRALIVPHAGYVFSGPVAATGYARLRGIADTIDRVVLLGPSHHVAVDGLAYCSADTFDTPLGPIPVDLAAIEELDRRYPFVSRLDAAHAREHSLEVHLPFLRTVLGEFTLVPLVVGRASGEQVATVLRELCDDPRTLPVISSDLSHYHDYETAVRIDSVTANQIERGEPSALRGDRACGCVPIAGLIELANERGWSLRTIDLRNSGDTAGDRSRVVGYGTFVATDEPIVTPREMVSDEATYSAADRRTLLEMARWSIRTGLESGASIVPDESPYPSLLRESRASFVTLRIDGALRGCMGTLEAVRPLVEDVAHNAYTAAFRDPRFQPLTRGEYDRLDVQISVLSPPVPFPVESEPDLLARVRPGVDGLILIEGNRRGTLLPSVWESLPEPAAFVGTLKRKAGLPEDYWSDTLRLYRYTAESFGDE